MENLQSSVDWQDIFYELKESDKTDERIQKLSKKMSEASGCRIEDYIKYSNNLCEGTDWKFLVCDQRTQLAFTPMHNSVSVTEEQLDQQIKGT